jgi:hypothetical protein
MRTTTRHTKLKLIPQCAARKLSAVSFQLLSGMKFAAACKEYEQ